MRGAKSSSCFEGRGEARVWSVQLLQAVPWLHKLLLPWGIMTSLEVTTQAGKQALHALPQFALLWVHQCLRKTKNRGLCRKQKICFQGIFLPFFFFPQHLSLLVCPIVSSSSAVSLFWVCVRMSSHSAASSSRLCWTSRENNQKSGLSSYAGLTVSWAHQCSPKQPQHRVDLMRYLCFTDREMKWKPAQTSSVAISCDAWQVWGTESKLLCLLPPTPRLTRGKCGCLLQPWFPCCAESTKPLEKKHINYFIYI